MINWNETDAAIWRQQKAYLLPVRHFDPIKLDDLMGIDGQKFQLVTNTERFLNSQPANNALLWGARGTGKSSLVKALLNAYKDQGLRLIEVDKQDLVHLPEIVDDIRDLAQRFIIYCDDLSFETGDSQYKSLKSVLEGSIEMPPDNVLVYATSNRRHLLPELMKDNLDSHLVDREVHYSDTVEEKTSLSDRFGLSLGFYPQTAATYLAIVDNLIPFPFEGREKLHKAALDYAHSRGSKSGRTAKQFYQALEGTV
jgi:hypothetical protein